MNTVHYADVAAQLRKAKENDAALLRQVRLAVEYLRTEHGYSLKTFAGKDKNGNPIGLTGLHKNSILRLKDPSWIPNPKTLEALTELIREAEILRKGGNGRVKVTKRGRPPAAAKVARTTTTVPTPARKTATRSSSDTTRKGAKSARRASRTKAN